MTKSAQWLHAWLLLLPAAVLLALFTHYPAVATLWHSFFSTPKGSRPVVFVGADNYRQLADDPIFWQALGNNLWYAAGTIPASIVIAILMAVWVNERIAGYRVSETVPLVYDAVELGERTPGFSTVTCFAKRLDLTHESFLKIWHGEHEACAIETQATFGYMRNEVIEPITDGAPKWDAIVEENFPMAALTDEQAFYDAVGDAEQTRANANRMFATVQKFLDLSTVDRTPCSEYNFA